VNETKNIVENLGIVRIVLETNELDTHNVNAFIRLGQEIPQQLIHGKRFQRGAGCYPAHAFRQRSHCVAKGFNFGCSTRCGGAD
jgi:tRNA splicing endonuclease